MAAGRGILGQCQDGAAAVGDHPVARGRKQPGPEGAAMFHAQVFAQIPGIEGPEIDHLIAMGVDDLDGLALAHANGLAAAGRNGL